MWTEAWSGWYYPFTDTQISPIFSSAIIEEVLISLHGKVHGVQWANTSAAG